MKPRGPWLLAALLFVAYGGVLSNGFINIDDGLHIHKNTHLNPPTPTGWLHLWKEPYKRLYIPVTYSVWAGLTHFAIPDNAPIENGSVPSSYFRTWVYHSANLVLHILTTACLVYFLLLRALGSRSAAWVGAALYGLHPLQVESVAWISGLKDTLSGFLAILSLVCYVKHLDASKEKAPSWYVAAAGAFLLALLAKPSTVILPLWIMAFAVLILNRKLKEVARDGMIWLVLSVPIVAITMRAQASEELEFAIPTFFQRLQIALDSVFFYLWKFVWPNGLAIDYGRSPTYVLGLPTFYFGALLIGAGLVAFLAIKFRSHRKILGASVLLFLIPLIPVLGIKPFVFQNISSVADRYLYLSLLAPALLVGYLFRAHAKNPPVGLAAVALFFLFVATFLQVKLWKSSETLLTHTAAINPRSWVSYNNLGVVYEADLKWEKALSAYEHSVAIREHPTIYNNMGAIHMELEQYSEALVAFQNATRLLPSDPLLMNNIGAAHIGMGRCREAKQYFIAALKQDPTLQQARDNLLRLQ